MTLQVSAVDLNSDWRIDMPENEVVLSENASSELWSGPCLQPSKEKASDQAAPSGTVVLLAKLVDQQGRVLARFSDWPQPYKLLDLPDPGIKVEVGDGEVVVSAAKPAKGVWLSVEGDDEGVEFDDNSVSPSGEALSRYCRY